MPFVNKQKDFLSGVCEREYECVPPVREMIHETTTHGSVLFLPSAVFAFTWRLRAAEGHKGMSGAASHCTKNKEQISPFVFDAQTHARPTGETLVLNTQ